MKTEDHGRQQAEAQLRSILAMVARLEHCEECDGDEDCDLTDEDIREGLGYGSQEPITDEMREEYHDRDAAEEAIHDDPLSVEVRSDWQNIGEELTPSEYCILLCTGGPACRIVGDLDGEPTSARLEYQDWGTPWTELITTGSDHAALLTYARQFYFSD